MNPNISRVNANRKYDPHKKPKVQTTLHLSEDLAREIDQARGKLGRGPWICKACEQHLTHISQAPEYKPTKLQITVHLPEELAREIDRVRGNMARDPWIRRACEMQIASLCCAAELEDVG